MLTLLLRSITHEAKDVNTFEFVDPAGGDLPPFEAGAHLDVHLPGGRVRQYSLCNNPCERHRYLIGVLRLADGRGGSRTMHDQLRVGNRVLVDGPRNHFPLEPDTTSALLLAGGIGVTPIMAMVEHLSAMGTDFTLHYCTRAPERTAFRDRLARHAAAGRVIYHFDGGDPARGLDVATLLRDSRPGTHCYCCGPAAFMDAVRRATVGWPAGSVHFEYFAAPALPATPAGAPPGAFTVRIASSGAEYAVPEGESILAVLRAHGLECPSACEAGVCGTCRTRYVEGEPEHNDFVLSDAERATELTICCSRAHTPLLVLDR